MNINLTGILANVFDRQANQTDGTAMGSDASKTVQALLQRLSVGQTISGTVKSSDGALILLDVGGGNELHARTEGDLQASPGQRLTFEVKSNSNGTVTLSPLFSNTAFKQSNILTALSDAGLPATEELVSMTCRMMEKGLPVDKQSLYEMNRALAQYPNASPETIVSLKSMGIELNQTNIVQAEATQNMQALLSETGETFVAELQSLFEEMVVTDPQTLPDLMQRIADVLPETTSDNTIYPSGASEVDTSAETQPLPAATIEAGDSISAQPVSEKSVNVPPKTELVSSESLPVDGSVFDTDKGTQENKTAAVSDQTAILSSQSGEKSVSLRSVVGEVHDLLQNEHLPSEERATLLQAKVKQFSQSLKSELENAWSLKPEEFADKDKVRDFYHKIKQQSETLESVLSSSGKANSQPVVTLQNIQQNLSFLENVNQAFPYLQFALKLSSETAKGELYVYAKKPGSSSEDGALTALLHLDMEHLGPMDVYVKLQDVHVSTRFVVADDSVLDFLAENIGLLEKRLAAKGYSVESSYDLSFEPVNPDVLSRVEGKTTLIPVSYNAFDMRA